MFKYFSCSLCLVFYFNISIAQNNQSISEYSYYPFKVNPKHVTYPSDTAFKWFTWDKAPEDIRKAAMNIFVYEKSIIYTLAKELDSVVNAYHFIVQVSAIDLDSNGIGGLAVYVDRKTGNIQFLICEDGYLKGYTSSSPASNKTLPKPSDFTNFIKPNENFAGIKDSTLKLFSLNPDNSPNNLEVKESGNTIPNVKILDADFCLSQFYKGLAIIIKGNQQVLIDSNGNFAQPFGKYWYTVFDVYKYKKEQGCGSRTGFITDDTGDPNGVFEIFSPQQQIFGLLNNKGKIIASVPITNSLGKYIEIYDFMELNNNDEYPAILDNRLDFTYLSFDGVKSAVFKNSRVVISEQLAACTPTGNMPGGVAIYGYKNLKGEFVISPVYDYASPFSDGVALIGKKDEFGIIKYGFIDHTGRYVINPVYSIKPSDFVNGVAKVTPKVTDEFDYAFINKKNEVIYKVKGETSIKNDNFLNYTGSVPTRNIACFNGVIIDSTGKIYSEDDIIGADFPNWKNYSVSIYSNFSKNGVITLADKNNPNLLGLIDLKLHVLIPPVFSGISTFDPVSKLAYASLLIKHDNATNEDVYQEGYINTQGLFVMIKGKKSVF